MLSILHRYVLRELLKSFAMAFVALTAVMLLGAIYQPLRLGLGFGELVRLLPYLLPYALAWVIPAAMLTACVMTYGRLSAENELAAVCTSGVPLRYMCYPAFLVALVLTAATIPLNDSLIPACRMAKGRIVQRAVLKEPFRYMLGAEETIEIGGYMIFVESVVDDELNNVIVVEPRGDSDPGGKKKRAEKKDSREVYVHRARKARYSVNEVEELVRIELIDAQSVIVRPGENPRGWPGITYDKLVKHIRTAEDVQDKLERRANMSTPHLLRRFSHQKERLAAAKRKAARQKSAEKKRQEEGQVENWERRVAHTATELHRREALAFATLVLCFVGVPLGIWMRRESRLASFAVAIFVFLLLYALMIAGEGLAKEQKVPPRLALWAPDALTGALGIGMLVHTFRR